MVDAVVSFALKRLGDFLIEEAVCLGRVSEEVQWLKDEVGWMQCYIASAEEKEDDDDGDDDGKYILRKWLTDITKIAYDAEDVLDNFILQTKLPEDIHKVLPNLECLLLKYSCLEDDPMPLLGKLPSLMILNLGSEFYTGKTLFCTAQGFPQLEILKLDDDDGLEEWQVEEGAMPKLRGLTIPENSKMRISERLREIPPPAE
ncbi:hypothetical protein Dsin_023724 [Dipteronia sinensis]|uniref:Disease resistance N-terminal domain-containing protein n=1 Tax=Dipteronia sinensis TaxID=43782 RepID=A0AAE0A5E1_9ROSI|nr:hypothetical protein Dsin_023724 [Dipteronia sinensis]